MFRFGCVFSQSLDPCIARLRGNPRSLLQKESARRWLRWRCLHCRRRARFRACGISFTFFMSLFSFQFLCHRVIGRPFTLSSCPWPSCLCIVLLFFFLFRACGIRCRSGWPTRRYSERYRGFQAATEKCQHVGSGLVSHRDVYDVRSIRSSEHLCDPAGQTLIRYDG